MMCFSAKYVQSFCGKTSSGASTVQVGHFRRKILFPSRGAFSRPPKGEESCCARKTCSSSISTNRSSKKHRIENYLLSLARRTRTFCATLCFFLSWKVLVPTSVFCSLSTVSSVFLPPLLLAKASVFFSKMQYKNTVKTYIHVTEIHAKDLHLRKNAAALRVGHYIQRHSLIFFPALVRIPPPSV